MLNRVFGCKFDVDMLKSLLNSDSKERNQVSDTPCIFIT